MVKIHYLVLSIGCLIIGCKSFCAFPNPIGLGLILMGVGFLLGSLKDELKHHEETEDSKASDSP